MSGNRPRTTLDGIGELSDVCLKRKIRDRLMDAGQNIFVQSDDRRKDEYPTLKARYDSLLKDEKDSKKAAKIACDKWYDVRAFGQVFAFKKGEKKEGVSIGVRGPVSIRPAFSLERVNVTDTQITKSVSSEGDGSKKSSDTMGMKHRVDHGTYVFYGTINPQLASLTGYSDADAEVLKALLPKLFEGDASSARPEGSMEVKKVIWWKHNSPSGQYSSAKVHGGLVVKEKERELSIEVNTPSDLSYEEIEGF